jgi:hypothetical protein
MNEKDLVTAGQLEKGWKIGFPLAESRTCFSIESEKGLVLHAGQSMVKGLRAVYEPDGAGVVPEGQFVDGVFGELSPKRFE